MLRLKGERDGDERDEITREDIFPADETIEPGPEEVGDVDPGRPSSTLPLRGLAVAAGTFVPTFLLIFFGLPYVLGSAAPARTPTTPGSSPLASLGTDTVPSPGPSASEVLRGDTRSDPAGRGLGGWLFSSPPAADEPRVEPPKAESPRVDSPRVDSKIEEPAPAVVPAPGPALPPRPSQAESSPPPEPRTPEASRRPAAAPAPSEARPPEPRPVPEPRRPAREPREWTPAAAFTDRAAAGRLASSIEKQGYPVEIRQDGSSSRPWVVWIGAQPSGSRRR
ncbi:MAG TPA: hypothetical protein VFO08_00930 [Methylomirabilota bacterium]|nr:hypothetical protein [Methylomirabilota bacterium]